MEYGNSFIDFNVDTIGYQPAIDSRFEIRDFRIQVKE